MTKLTTTAPLSILKSIPCFADLGPEAMEWLLDSMQEQSFAKGEVIMLEGEPCLGLFVIKSGSVKLYRNSLDGEEHIVRAVTIGECFDCAPLLDKLPNPVSAQALESCTVYFIPRSHFEMMINVHPQVLLGIVSILSMRLRSFLSMAGNSSSRRVSSRLAKLLLQLSERQDDTQVLSPSPPLNQQHLACMLGCSRQVVNGSLQKLSRDGIIRKERRRIVLLKPEALKEIS